MARNELLLWLQQPALLNSHEDIARLLSGSCAPSLRAIARFLARARQIRRRQRAVLESYSHGLERSSFAERKAAWRFKGKYAC